MYVTPMSHEAKPQAARALGPLARREARLGMSPHSNDVREWDRCAPPEAGEPMGFQAQWQWRHATEQLPSPPWLRGSVTSEKDYPQGGWPIPNSTDPTQKGSDLHWPLPTSGPLTPSPGVRSGGRVMRDVLDPRHNSRCVSARRVHRVRIFGRRLD